MNKKITILFCLTALLLGAGLRAAEDTATTPARDAVNSAADLVNSPYPEERVEGIRAYGMLSDEGVIKDFKIIDTLLKIAKESNYPIERSEALKSLGSLIKKGFGSLNTLEFLVSVVINKDERSIRVRNNALMVIADLARATKDSGPIVKSAFNALKKIWDKRKSGDTHPSMLENILDAMGGFADEDGTRKILLEGLEEKYPSVREGALRGLRRYVEATKSTDKNILRDVTSALLRAKKAERREEVVEAVLTLDALFANGASPSGPETVKSLLELLETGGDVEAQAAVRVLLRIPSPSIVEAMIVASRPNKERGWSFDTYHCLSKALAGIVSTLSKGTASEETADKIRDQFLWTLDPQKKMPDVMKKSAIFGLGYWPVTLDRQAIVKSLIGLLETEQNELLAKAIEESLENLTNKHFRDGADKPDLARWKEWYEKNSGTLAPGKTPWEMEK